VFPRFCHQSGTTGLAVVTGTWTPHSDVYGVRLGIDEALPEQ
jgi:hypothetical protein